MLGGLRKISLRIAASGFFRLPAFCGLVALSALLFTGIGWLMWIEFFLSDSLYFRGKRAPGGQIVIVQSNEAAVAATGRYPFDRELLAKALLHMDQAGAKRFYLDTLLTHSANREEDDALEAAFARLGPERLALTLTRSPTAVGNEAKFITPLHRFSQHASSAALNYAYDPDRRIRKILPRGSLPAGDASDWLLGVKGLPDAPLHLDFSLDLARIPAFNLLDVAAGKVAAEAFAGKSVVFGISAFVAGLVVDVPVYKGISRAEFVALATETRLQPVPLWRFSGGQSFAFLFGMAVFVSLLFRHLRPGFVNVAFIAVLAGWIGLASNLHQQTGLMAPLLPTLAVILIVWQRTFLQTSRLGRALRQLKQAIVGVDHAALLTAIDAMGEPAMLFDRHASILGCNHAFAELEKALSRIHGSDHTLVGIFGADGLAILERLQDVEKAPLSLTLGQGAMRQHFEVRIRAVRTPVGTIGVAGFTDVSLARRREAELTTLAFADPLTGLTNRLAFHARLEAASAAQAPFALMLIDLDGFKAVNDGLGHDAGDQLLIGVAGRLRDLMAPQDIAARLGGDEFALLVHAANASAAMVAAQAVLSAILPPFRIDGREARVGASIGVAMFPADERDGRALLKLADAAMYRAKAIKPAVCLHGDAPMRRAS